MISEGNEVWLYLVSNSFFNPLYYRAAYLKYTQKLMLHIQWASNDDFIYCYYVPSQKFKFLAQSCIILFYDLYCVQFKLFYRLGNKKAHKVTIQGSIFKRENMLFYI